MISSKHLISGAVIASSLVLPIASQAQTIKTPVHKTVMHAIKKPLVKKDTTKTETPHINKYGVSGAVASINGTTLTITGSNNTTYTVDASQAKFSESAASQYTIANIQVGDKVSVSGTVTGTNVVAKSVFDSSLMSRTMFSGTVTAISGSTITITGMNKTTYTVDASQAAITRMQRPTTKGAKATPTTLAITDVKVGDRLMINGTINGTAISATKISDPGSFKGGMMGRFRGMGGAKK